jgi:hypothetical protein
MARPLTEAAAHRYTVFQTQLDIHHAGLERIAHVRMPGAPAWQPGVNCVSCGMPTRRRRCSDCRAAIVAILGQERKRLGRLLLELPGLLVRRWVRRGPS